MRHLYTRKQRVTALAFSPDGRHLAVGGTGKRVDVWDFGKTKAKPVLLPTVYQPIAWLGFTPGGQLVVVNDYGGFQLYDPASTVLRSPFTPGYGITSTCVLSADGAALFTSGKRTAQFKVTPKFPLRWAELNTGPSDPRLDPAGGCFLDPAGRLVVPLVDGYVRTRLRTHDPDTGAVVGERHLADVRVASLCASPDRTAVAFVNACQLYAGPLAGAAIPPVPLPNMFVSVAFHPSGKWLVCGTGTGVRVYDAATWREAQVLELGAGPLDVLAFDAGGTRAAAGNDGGTVVVWDWDL